ncbi:MAG: hypothetical protein Q9216_007118, partial [Gyalolechia sp. 2 TL-2023]
RCRVFVFFSGNIFKDERKWRIVVRNANPIGKPAARKSGTSGPILSSQTSTHAHH